MSQPSAAMTAQIVPMAAAAYPATPMCSHAFAPCSSSAATNAAPTTAKQPATSQNDVLVRR